MKAKQSLPEGYSEIFSVDLQKNKKIAWFIQLFSVVLALALAIPMHLHIPISTLFDLESGLGAYMARLFSLLVLIAAYMILHELVHGIAMKLCGTRKVKYGFTGLYAFAGSEDYYGKRSYLAIALAPVVIWGIVIALVNAVVPREWFWIVYLIQIINVSGAAGDIYVTVKFLGLPKDILVKDSGVGMTVYSRKTAEDSAEKSV